MREFSLDSKKVPFRLTTSTGESQDFEIREMTAANRDTYMEQLRQRMKLDSEGTPVGLVRYEGLQADLLVLCVWNLKDNKLVSHGVIQSWPASVVNELYTEAQRMHQLPGAKETPEKNE